MNLHPLEYFVKLAQTKNYTKAAKECFISQPALSRAISDLESKMGYNLFERTSRSVELTKEGELALPYAKKILSTREQMFRELQQYKENNKKAIRVGYVIYGYLAIINQRISEKAKINEISLDPIYDTVANTCKNLYEDEIDVALLPQIPDGDFSNHCAKDNQIESQTLLPSKLHVLVHKDNKLFRKKSVTFSDLRGQQFIGWHPEDVPVLSDCHLKVLKNHKVIEEYTDYCRKLGDLMTLCILKKAVGVVSKGIAPSEINEFRSIEIEDSEEKFGVNLVWKKDNATAQIKRLLEVAKQ
ncbi:MAG TPA: hypothetical protein DHN33_11925 [Eubacteriaceae bacterium]|nr:hypothetical protein [Eubacteriaceae bacterium]